MIMAILAVVLTLCFAGLVEFGRVLIAREELQTGADAASLAAAYSGANRYVKVEVVTDLGERRECDTDCWWECDDQGNCDRECDTDCWCEDCGIVTRTVTGPERDLIDNGGWQDYCAEPCDPYRCENGSCDYEIEKRWLKYERRHSESAAEAFVFLNSPSQAETAWLTHNSPRVYNEGEKYYPSVTVYAKARVKSLFAGLFGAFPESYETEVCAQGGTFYKTLSGGRSEVPEDACWKDIQ